MVEVIATDEFADWYRGLGKSDEPAAMAVTRVVDLLEAKGVALGHPYSSAIKGTTYPLRELRIQSGGRPLRVFYAFDPERQAVLLLGGDKSGDANFYNKFIPRAEQIWVKYVAEQESLPDQEEE